MKQQKQSWEKMKQDLDLYYKAPTNKVFNEVKREAIKIWQGYDDTHGYATGKINRIRDLENIRDNMMFIFGMFDIFNQLKLANKLSDISRTAIEKRLPKGYVLSQFK